LGGALPILLAAVGIAASGCTTGGQHAPPPRVLGQPARTPLVLGQPAPTGSDLGALSCPDPSHCWAVGVAGPDTGPGSPATVIVATKDGGSHWTPEPVTGGFIPQLSAVSCPDRTHCMAVGSNGASVLGSGVVFTTDDAGATWRQVAAPPGVLSIGSVVCPARGQCTVVVNDGAAVWSARSADFGRTWQRMGNLPGGFVGTDAMSCTEGGPCLIGGFVPSGTGHGTGAITLSPDGGQTWALASVPSGIGLLQGATCLSATECLAVGSTSTTVSDVVPALGQLLRSVDGGHTWAAAASPPVAGYGIACPSTRVCTLVGTKWTGSPAVGSGAVAQSRDGGATFKESTSAYVPFPLTAVDCPTAAHCVAVGGATVARITVVPPAARHDAPKSGTSASTRT
jgi:photosystem II stability/assembly factor-like uncharacterized protein